MNAATQKKGPASVGALPDHGSIKSDEGTGMNVHSNITAAPGSASNFPIPYVNQDPSDGMSNAMALLRVLLESFASQRDFTDSAILISDVLDQLEPVRLFLEGVCDPSDMATYRECRRQHIVSKAGAA